MITTLTNRFLQTCSEAGNTKKRELKESTKKEDTKKELKKRKESTKKRELKKSLYESSFLLSSLHPAVHIICANNIPNIKPIIISFVNDIL